MTKYTVGNSHTKFKSFRALDAAVMKLNLFIHAKTRHFDHQLLGLFPSSQEILGVTTHCGVPIVSLMQRLAPAT